MEQIILILCLLSLKFSAIAQQEFPFDEEKSSYATVKDTDGFVNVRKAPNNNAPVIGKIFNYNVFSCEPNKTNWWKVLCMEHDGQTKSYFLEAYIHKSRVFLLKNWKIISKNDKIRAIVEKTAFDHRKHKLFYAKDDTSNATSVLKKIDGRFF